MINLSGQEGFDTEADELGDGDAVLLDHLRTTTTTTTNE
jgi:hypothetical protein